MIFTKYFHYGNLTVYVNATFAVKEESTAFLAKRIHVNEYSSKTIGPKRYNIVIYDHRNNRMLITF